MKTFSDRTKAISAIVGITISYTLIILKINFISEKFEHFSDGRMWAFSEFGFSFLCISIPILIVELVFQIKYRHLLLDIPILFLFVSIYSPDGWYFIYCKGGFILSSPDSRAWLNISIIFCFIHLVTISFLKFLRYVIRETRGIKNLYLQNPEK